MFEVTPIGTILINILMATLLTLHTTKIIKLNNRIKDLETQLNK